MAAFATLPEVKALVPDATFKRAKELASSNKFRHIRFEGPYLQECVANCVGSNEGDIYSLSAVIKAESSSKPLCECSCPAAAQARGNFCKHVVALLLLRIKEVSKVSQQKTNTVMSSELDLQDGKLRQSSLSDSQATEPFVECRSMAVPVDNEICSSVLSSSNVIENRKRVLPSWISESFSVGKKEVEGTRGKKGASKRTKNNATSEGLNVEEDESKICIGADDGNQKALETKKGKDEGIAIGRERRNMKKNSELARKRKLSDAIPVRKRRKSKVFVESDLSEEDEPTVIDSHYLSSNESKDGMDLTSEDLLKMAKEHLQMGNSNENQECENSENDEIPVKTSVVKKKGSIFSVEGWNEVAKTSLDAKKRSLNQEVFGKPDLATVSQAIINKDENFKRDSQDKDEDLSTIASFESEGSGKILERMEPAANVVDDMLGLFFGPSLSKIVTSKPDCTQAMTEDLTSTPPEHSTPKLDLTICDDSAPSLSSSKAATTRTENTQGVAEEMMRSIAHPEISAPETSLPMISDSAPKPKKKGSLKDKVKMFLS